MISFSSLENHNVNEILKNYCDILKSHYNDHYKLIVNNCNNKLLSCHHLTTIYHIDFDSPICQFITHFIRELPYTGLYYGIITSSFLSKVLELKYSCPERNHLEMISCLDRVKEVVVSYLEQNKTKGDLNGHGLISLVLYSLKALPLDNVFISKLAVSVVKAALIATDECTQKIGHISIKSVNGSDVCEAYNGILYKLESFWIPKKENICDIQVLLFTEHLNFNGENGFSIEEFLANIMAAKIKVVACQKTIDNKIKYLLRRQNIFTLERLGEETTYALAQLCGSFLISDYNSIKWHELNSMAGILSGLKFITIMNEDYLLLEKKNVAVATLFISQRNMDISDQLKAVIKECLHSIYSILKCPYFLPKNFDISLAKEMKSYKESDVLYKQMLSLFADSLLEIGSNKLQSEINLQENCYDIYLLKRNSLIQVFLTIINVLQIGLYVVKT